MLQTRGDRFGIFAVTPMPDIERRKACPRKLSGSEPNLTRFRSQPKQAPAAGGRQLVDGGGGRPTRGLQGVRYEVERAQGGMFPPQGNLHLAPGHTAWGMIANCARSERI